MVPVFDRRKLRPLILALAIALCAFQLTTCTGMWLLDPLIVRATHVGLVLSMLFLWRSSNRALRKNPRPEPAWSFLFDILMIAMSAGAAAYIITNFSYIQDRMPHIDELTAWDLFWGAGLIIAILEATRRVAGLALVIVSGIALLYAFFGHLLPGNMGHLYLAPNQIIESLYLLNDGIWGSSIGASATIIYVFILFGALLEKTNMASVFLELACLVTRNAKGGPAKAAIFGSALFGSVSGSAAANVYATGTFTIPLMKRVGYRPEFSGAVEAVASSGGLIMPPVMGSIAFVMAEYTGISYLSICKAALLPAVLYYLSLFTMIHFEALRHGLGGTPPDLIPELRSIKRKLYYLAPLALLIVLMIAGRSIIFSALLACAAVVALSFLSPETRLTPARFLAAMENVEVDPFLLALIALKAALVRILPEGPVKIGLIIIIADPDGIVLLKAAHIGAVCVGCRIENGLYAIVRLQQIQHFLEILLCLCGIRRTSAQGLIEFHIDHRRQGIFRHRNGLDKVFRLLFFAVFEPEKVIGTYIHLGRLGSFPVLRKLAVIVVYPLCGLDKAEAYTLLRQQIPVNVSLIIGQVYAPNRIFCLAWHIRFLPSGAGTVNVQQPGAPDTRSHQSCQHQQRQQPVPQHFSK